MQIDTSHTVTVTSNIDAPATAMTLDPEGMAHLIQVLTNLYSDKHLAVLREYSTNALDSHVAAGNPAPIEVTLPSVLNPTLVITDHGVGLSRQEITEVYAKYGASTKRNTNTQVGSFGLGAKSAFTIGGQFIVTATKDGRRCAAVFALDQHGVGSVSILAEHPSTDPNGVTISVAVDEPAKMQEAAEKFFRAWRPGTVLVDGREPAGWFTQDDALWLGEDVLFTKTGGITVVMGSVAYPLPGSAVSTVRERVDGDWRSWGDRPGLVVFVPIGAVDITPSREGVRDTERTIATVARALADLPGRFARALDKIIADAPDTVSMVLAARPLLNAAEWIGVPMVGNMPADVTDAGGRSFGLTQRGSLYSDPMETISYATLPQLTVLVGVPPRRAVKRHAKHWLSTNTRKTLVMFGDGSAVSGAAGWFTWGGDSPVRTVHWDDIHPPVKQKAAANPRGAFAYSVSVIGQGWQPSMTPAELKAETRPVAYVRADHPLGRGDYAPLAGYVVVELAGQQSEDVLLRRVPGIQDAASIIAAHTKRRLAALGDLDAIRDAEDHAEALDRIARTLGESRVARLTHPTYLAAVARSAAFTRLSDEDRNLVQQHTTYRHTRSADDLLADVARDLPLLMHVVEHHTRHRSMTDAAADHLVTYVNAAPVPAATSD